MWNVVTLSHNIISVLSDECLQGHISFPLLLNLSPFAGGASSAGPLAMNVQRDGQHALHLYRQLNMQMSLNVLPTPGGYLSSQPCKEEATNNSGHSIHMVSYSNFIKFYYLIWVVIIWSLVIFRQMLCLVHHHHHSPHRHRQGASYMISQQSLSTTGNVEEGIMQFTGELHQILILMIKGNLLQALAGGGFTYQMATYQKFQRKMFCVRRPRSFSMKDCSLLLSS